MLTDRFDAAMLCAAGLHRAQLRKGTTIPYLSHVLGVTALVVDDGGSEDEAVAALLHDTLEDCGDQYPGGRDALRKYIAQNFGTGILEIVEQCTDDEGFVKGRAATPEEERELWLARKAKYAASVCRKPPEALRVTTADKVHNAESIIDAHQRWGASIWERFRTQRRDDQIYVYETISSAISARAVELGGVRWSALPARLWSAVERMRQLS